MPRLVSLASMSSRNVPGRPLAQIRGMTPSLLALDAGCAFRERCPRAVDECRKAPPVRHPVPARALRCVNPVA